MDAETKKRIEAAAAEKNLSVNEYLLDSVRHQLMQDGRLQAKQAGTVKRPIFETTLLDEADKLHAAILKRRGGEPIDIDAILD